MVLAICLVVFLAPIFNKLSARTPQPLSIVAAAVAERFSSILDHADPASRAPTYALRGKVINSFTNEPIRNALVEFDFGAQRFALTGIDGTFEFDSLSDTGQAASLPRSRAISRPKR
jgi:hypothetical protein